MTGIRFSIFFVIALFSAQATEAHAVRSSTAAMNSTKVRFSSSRGGLVNSEKVRMKYLTGDESYEHKRALWKHKRMVKRMRAIKKERATQARLRAQKRAKWERQQKELREKRKRERKRRIEEEKRKMLAKKRAEEQKVNGALQPAQGDFISRIRVAFSGPEKTK